MARYRPDIPPHVAEVIRRLPPDVRRGVKAAIRALGADPSAGELLRGELAGYMKYRVRRYRVVWMLRVVAVGHRRSVYELLRASA